MPYKDSQKQKDYDRERKRKGRTNDKDVLPDNSNVLPVVEMFEGKPRYLTLSDGQVLDRTYQPKTNKHIPGMIACNRSNALRFGKGTDTEKAAKLLMICNALDKEVTGLPGKVNLLSQVRYGVSGSTFTQVKTSLQ